jgi:hypothetical protein
MEKNPRLKYMAESFPIVMPAYPDTSEEDLRKLAQFQGRHARSSRPNRLSSRRLLLPNRCRRCPNARFTSVIVRLQVPSARAREATKLNVRT